MRLFGLVTLALVAMAVIAITPVLSQNMKEPVVAKTNDGMGEGINVHGDWEVKVTDPETGVEELYAFSNRFSPMGRNILAAALVGNVSYLNNDKNSSSQGQQYEANYDPAKWMIHGNIGKTDGDYIGAWSGYTCQTTYVTPVVATESELLNTNWAGTGGSYEQVKLRLSGTCEVPISGLLTVVSTVHHQFEANAWDFKNTFTEHYLNPESGGDGFIPIQKGQLISYNVLISFPSLDKDGEIIDW